MLDKTSRRLVSLALVTVLAPLAKAGSSSSSSASFDYLFDLDAGSAGHRADLVVTDLGTTIYNLVNSDPSAYQTTTGTGAASTAVDGNTGFTSTNWSGHTGISSSASEATPTGTGTASVGAQQNLTVRNAGATTLTLVISGLAKATGTVSVSGPSSASNFAKVDTYVGIYDFDLTTSVAVANPLIHVAGSDSAGVTTSITSDWTPPTMSVPYYAATYRTTLAPGASHLLSFYTSGLNGTAAAVPEPSTLLAFAGLAGAVLRRRAPR